MNETPLIRNPRPGFWKTKNREWDFRCHGAVMGILNLTADSFSDGGAYLDPEVALAHALAMEAEGAQIIDVGGESTRPGAAPVSEREELARVLPVLERLQGRLTQAVVSIDTSKAAVARAAVEYGAEIINDVTALQGDPGMARVAAESGAGIILMHMRGEPRTMQAAPEYGDVVSEVRDFLLQRTAAALRSGVSPEKIALDPGIGFGKTVEHNLTLLRHLDALVAEGWPVVLGVSRKSFLGKITNTMAIEDRSGPTMALTCLGRNAGVAVVRVHEVRPNVEALQVVDAVLARC